MLSSIFLTILPAFIAAVHGAPAAEDSDLSARGGNHYASVYNGAGCTGNSLATISQFPCGGVCYSYSPIWSVFLEQDTVDNPKPTADFYSSNNCQGSVLQHAGIYSGEHSGCTTMPSEAQSFYLYFNC